MAEVFIAEARVDGEKFLVVTCACDPGSGEQEVALEWDSPKAFCFRVNVDTASRLLESLKTALESLDRG